MSWCQISRCHISTGVKNPLVWNVLVSNIPGSNIHRCQKSGVKCLRCQKSRGSSSISRETPSDHSRFLQRPLLACFHSFHRLRFSTFSQASTNSFIIYGEEDQRVMKCIIFNSTCPWPHNSFWRKEKEAGKEKFYVLWVAFFYWTHFASHAWM